jgi:hypothetical protein
VAKYESITPFATQISKIGVQPTSADIHGNGAGEQKESEDKEP